MEKNGKVCAFFDVDGTILRITSLKSFQASYFKYAYKNQAEGLEAFNNFKNIFMNYQKEGRSREYMNKEYYKTFKDRSRTETLKIAKVWWDDTVARVEDLFVHEVLDCIKQYKSQKHSIVLVSGSFAEVVAPVAEHIGADHIIATNLEVENDVYTGEMIGPQLIGEGKRDAIQLFAKKNSVDLALCSAYGDHVSDLPMLETVGHPFVVAGDAELDVIAATKGWGSIKTVRNLQEGG